jgi:hypothetical protein
MPIADTLRKLVSLSILVLLFVCLSNPIAQAELKIDRIHARDWLEAGIEKTKQGNYQQAILDFNEAIAI